MIVYMFRLNKKTVYEILPSRVGAEVCIRERGFFSYTMVYEMMLAAVGTEICMRDRGYRGFPLFFKGNMAAGCSVS